MFSRREHLDLCLSMLGARSAGAVIETPSSLLVPVFIADDSPPPSSISPVVGGRVGQQLSGQTWMLKCAFGPEERAGLEVQARWDCGVASIVFLIDAQWEDGPRVALMPVGEPLDQMSFQLSSVRRLCDAVARLHSSTSDENTGLESLEDRFRALRTCDPHEVERATKIPNSAVVVSRARADVAELFATPLDQVSLHGDVHHGNLLHFSGEPQPWLLIDPKGVRGESLFDYANIVFNPDVLDPQTIERFPERIETIGQHLHEHYGVDLTERFLRWVRAYGCLSTLWHLEDRSHRAAAATLRIAATADAHLA